MTPMRWERPEWIASHVAEELPGGVQVTARVLTVIPAVEITLATRWWRHRRVRKRILVQACMAVADAPAGLPVRVRWRQS